MLYREIIAVFSQIHTKHINTLREQNVELLNVKDGCKIKKIETLIQLAISYKELIDVLMVLIN
jgi:hypothetical protein